MRVEGWFVDGFGVLSSFETRELPAGLVVFEGSNEAGKSTLLAFLRGVLFGFPRMTKGKRPHYPPLAGGSHGGRVFLRVGSEEVTIERGNGRPTRITLADGSELGDPEFQRLIGGVDAQTFRTVFAFSLDELSDFDSLTGDQVRSRIFSAGVGGAGPSVRQVAQDLEKVTGQLLKPRSRDAEINALLGELTAREQELREARSRSEGYPQLLAEEEVVGAQLRSLDDEEQALRNERATYERLLDLWPVWVDHELDCARLAELDPIDQFVPDPIQSLAEAKQALEGALQASERLDEQKRRIAAEEQGLRAESRPGLAELGIAVDKQVGLVPLYRERLHEREAARNRVRLGEERLRTALQQLGGEVDEAGLAAIDTSVTRAEAIREWRGRLAEALDREKATAERLEAAAGVHERAKAERDRQTAAIEDVGTLDVPELTAKAQALRALRVGLAEVAAKRAALEGRLIASEAAARAVSVETPPGVQAPSPRGSLLLLAVGIVLAVGAVIMGLVGEGLASIIALAVLAAASFAAAGFTLSRRRRLSAAPEPDLARVLRAEQAAQEELRVDLVRTEGGLLAMAVALGRETLPDLDELDRLEVALAQQERTIIKWQEQKAELQRAEERLQILALDELEARDKAERARATACALEAEFKQYLGLWGVPATLSPQGVEEYLRYAAVAKQDAFRLEEDRAAVDRIEQEISRWQVETARLVEDARPHLSLQVDADLELALLQLADARRQEAERQSRLSALREKGREQQADEERLRGETQKASARWADLLARVGAADEAAFRQKLSIFEERSALKRRVGEGEELLVKRIGRGVDSEAFRGLLAQGEVESWEERGRELERRLDDIHERRAELTKIQGDVERRRRELEESADVPGLETKVEGLRTDLDSVLHRWRAHTLAAALVRNTLSVFIRERQPLVLAEASRMFERLTGGRYPRVLRAADEEGIVVIEKDGRAKMSEELSRGTAEQLYLCLRLGLAEEFSRRAEPMPLVMDDVLVNFDPVRRRATAKLLLEFAERHQILLFTCHPEIEELIRSERPQTRVVRMS